MATKHTPGPWHVETPMDECFSIVDDAKQVYDWKMVANVTWDHKDEREPGCPFITKREAEANARLIAAAPDLYHELDMQIRNCPVCKGDGMAVDIFDMLTTDGRPPLKPCSRCSSARAALSRATQPAA